VEDGSDVEEARAAKMDGWIVWEVGERVAQEPNLISFPFLSYNCLGGLILRALRAARAEGGGSHLLSLCGT